MTRSRPAAALVVVAVLVASCGIGPAPVARQPSLVSAEPADTLAAALDARMAPASAVVEEEPAAAAAVPTRPDTTGSISVRTHAVIGARGMRVAPPGPTPIPDPPPFREEPVTVPPDSWQRRDLVVPGTVDAVVAGYVAMLEVAGLETVTQVASAPQTGPSTEVFATSGDEVVAAVTVSAAADGVLVTERWTS